MSKNLSVLVVEDEKMLQDAIVTKLTKLGHKAYAYESGAEAVKYLKGSSKLPDVIWLDYYLIGEMNGVEFVEELRKDNKYANVPIVVVSNTAGDDKVKRFKELGVKKCYLKAEERLDSIIAEISTYVSGSNAI